MICPPKSGPEFMLV
jgi:putative transposase